MTSDQSFPTSPSPTFPFYTSCKSFMRSSLRTFPIHNNLLLVLLMVRRRQLDTFYATVWLFWFLSLFIDIFGKRFCARHYLRGKTAMSDACTNHTNTRIWDVFRFNLVSGVFFRLWTLLSDNVCGSLGKVMISWQLVGKNWGGFVQDVA